MTVYKVKPIWELLKTNKKKLKKGSGNSKFLMLYLRDMKKVKKKRQMWTDRAKRGWEKRRKHLKK